jgi:hypothetical protein
MSLAALCDDYRSDEDGLRAAIQARIDGYEATIARLTHGGVTANLYAGELAAARQGLRFAITDLSLLGLYSEEESAA